MCSSYIPELKAVGSSGSIGAVRMDAEQACSPDLPKPLSSGLFLRKHIGVLIIMLEGTFLN